MISDVFSSVAFSTLFAICDQATKVIVNSIWKIASVAMLLGIKLIMTKSESPAGSSIRENVFTLWRYDCRGCLSRRITLGIGAVQSYIRAVANVGCGSFSHRWELD